MSRVSEIAESIEEFLESIRGGLTTHDDPAWVAAANQYVSVVVSIVIIAARLVAAVAVLAWTAFLLLLPLYLGVLMLVGIVTLATPPVRLGP